MTNTNKLTKAIKLGMVVEFMQEVMEEKGFEFDGFNAVEFLNAEIELINKRNNSKKKASGEPTKKQVENYTIANGIYDFLDNHQGEHFNAMEINDALSLGFTSQKMTPLLKLVVEMGALKDKVKGKVVYFVEKVEEETSQEQE